MNIRDMRHTQNSPQRMSNSEFPEDQIREELSRILASDAFSRSSRIKKFLQYVVDEALRGRADRIKAFTVARDVFGRDERFDPQRDTIVRVEAGRLRRRLAAFYAGPGKASKIRIDIPVGGYAPVFVRINNAAPTNSRLPGTAVWLTLALAVVALAMWYSFLRPESPSPVSGTADAQNRPFIAVLPFESPSGSEGDERIAAGLVESLITDLTKLSGLSVMAHASMIEFARNEVSIDELQRKYGISHVLRGSLWDDGERLRVNLHLIATGTMTTMWAEELVIEAAEFATVQKQLASHITDELNVEVSVSEQSDFLRQHSESVEALAFYRQAWILLIPPNDVTRIQTARRLFHRSGELDPEFAGAQAGEGFSHAITVLFVKPVDTEEELATALALAETAIEKDPKFGMGYGTKAFAHALSGNAEEGLKSAEQAIRLSPGDAFVQFIYGMNLVISGRPGEALAPLQRALVLDPAEPRTPYLNVLGIAFCATGDFQKAVEKFDSNGRRGGPTGPHMEVFRAVALARTGNRPEAREIVGRLNESYPEFPFDRWLHKWLGDGEQYAAFIEELTALGLVLITR